MVGLLVLKLKTLRSNTTLKARTKMLDYVSMDQFVHQFFKFLVLNSSWIYLNSLSSPWTLSELSPGFARALFEFSKSNNHQVTARISWCTLISINWFGFQLRTSFRWKSEPHLLFGLLCLALVWAGGLSEIGRWSLMIDLIYLERKLLQQDWLNLI